MTLFKDKVYDDFGFSISDGLFERGIYVNRIRPKGPADMCGLLRPFDRILQVSSLGRKYWSEILFSMSQPSLMGNWPQAVESCMRRRKIGSL